MGRITEIQTRNWGATPIMTFSGNAGLGARGTFYMFRNGDNGDKFLFFFGTLGFGLNLGFRLNQTARNIYKAVATNKNFDNPDDYTKIVPNKAFSIDDLDWSPGVEATIGIAVLTAAASATAISAYPFFDGPPKPGEEVNNDYFTSQVVYGKTDLGLSIGGSYQFIGRWKKLYSFGSGKS